jgi:hypothetical protein
MAPGEKQWRSQKRHIAAHPYLSQNVYIDKIHAFTKTTHRACARSTRFRRDEVGCASRIDSHVELLNLTASPDAVATP